MRSDRLRIGLLFPTRDADTDDFAVLASRLTPEVQIEAVDLPWPQGIPSLGDLRTDEQLIAALRALGSDEHLRPAAVGAVEGRAIDVVAFGVTSSSFLSGVDGARHQQRVLALASGRPATSTTVGFLDAVDELGLRRVGLASVYPPSIADHFVACLGDSGVEIVRRVDADARSDGELAGWSPDRIVDLVRSVAHPEAEAVLLPETALHTAVLTDELEAAAGVPVITATQVTLWSAARHADVAVRAARSGPLLA